MFSHDLALQIPFALLQAPHQQFQRVVIHAQVVRRVCGEIGRLTGVVVVLDEVHRPSGHAEPEDKVLDPRVDALPELGLQLPLIEELPELLPQPDFELV